MPAKVESTPALPGLSPVCGKPIIARFDGGKLSSDGGVLALREIETRLGIANRLAACVADPRAQERVIHSMADILRFRMLMIAAGYEDANDADSLRRDPAFKLALGRLPDAAALCSQPTISRLENLPRPRELLRMGQAIVGLYCDSFRQVPRRITLDIDDTFDAVQQCRNFFWISMTASARRSWSVRRLLSRSNWACSAASGWAGARLGPRLTALSAS
jgi:hypothetical protein